MYTWININPITSIRIPKINKLKISGQSKGLTMVPLGLYLKRGMAKVTLALAKGKRQYEKRRVIVQRDIEREIRRELKQR